MKRIVAVCLFTLSAYGADFELGLRHVDATVSSDAPLDVNTSRGFGPTLEVFVSKHVSLHTAATLLNPETFANDVDLGTLGIDSYTLGARWHLRDRARFSAYLGGGGAIVNVGDLDDQLGDEIYANFENDLTWYAEGGVRYRVLPRVVLELGVIYTAVSVEPIVARSNIALPATLELNPVIVSAAAAYRF